MIVAKVLENYSVTLNSSETYESKIRSLIEKAERKGESKKMLAYRLGMEYPQSRELIQELLKTYDDSEILVETIAELSKKYPPDKLFQKLMQKGFAVTDIQRELRGKS